MANVKQKAILRLKNKAIEESLLEMLLRTGKVKFGNIGIFEVIKVDGYEGYNIADGTRVEKKPHNRIRFRPSQTFKREIQAYEPEEN